MPPRAALRRPGDRHGPRGCPGVPDGKLRIPESPTLLHCSRPECDCEGPLLSRGSPTHQKMISFLEKAITPSKVQFYTRARENFVNETFNSVINKYATKRTHYHKSHEARLGCCAMDWNENILREPLRIYERRPQHTTVRNRTTTRRELPERTTQWKTELRDSLFGVHEAP